MENKQLLGKRGRWWQSLEFHIILIILILGVEQDFDEAHPHDHPHPHPHDHHPHQHQHQHQHHPQLSFFLLLKIVSPLRIRIFWDVTMRMVKISNLVFS